MKPRILNRLYLVATGLGILLMPLALWTGNLVVAVLSVGSGILGVVFICWRNVLLQDVPPGSPEDCSQEFRLLPDHPAAEQPQLVPSARVGCLIWVAISSVAWGAALLMGENPFDLCCSVIPGLFLVLVLMPWAHFRFFEAPAKRSEVEQDDPRDSPP